MRGAGGLMGSLAGVAGRALGAVAEQAQRRVPKADLDERDPDYIRDTLPRLWLLASLYFRAEVRGLERIPEEGPGAPRGQPLGRQHDADTGVFTLAFNTYFGVERRFYQLAHNLVLSMPGLGLLRKYGTVAANPANAAKALDSGAALLVYPGGDYEVHRPTWESGPRGLRRPQGLPPAGAQSTTCRSCPVVSIGGQETALFLSAGRGSPSSCRLDRMFRLKVLPISLALPWVPERGRHARPRARCPRRSPSRCSSRSTCARSSARSRT